MNNYKKYTTKIGARDVEVEIGKYAYQSNGSCIIRSGETVVMVNVTMNKNPREGQDYFPLGVDFEEKMYSVGKIPGGFKRREGRPSDQAILTSRLIDRPLRPLFPEGFFNDVSIVATALSVDPEVVPEPLAMLGSSIALSISDIPFSGPTGSVQIGLINNEFVVNPSLEEREISALDLTVSGTEDAILMVEAGANIVSEEVVLDAIMFAHQEIKKQVEFQNKIVKDLKVVKDSSIVFHSISEDLRADVAEFATSKIVEVMKNYNRKERTEAEELVEKEVLEHFAEKYEDQSRDVLDVLGEIKKQVMRDKILNEGIRPDGRALDQVRDIWCEVGVLPRVHGSGVFTRGETQALTTVTLGALRDMQKLEGLDDHDEKRYMHHYNFPPYSVGEARGMRGTSRREIGHGALAERSLLPVLPTEEEFPYAIRTVSEILSSNGSTSQASVCGSSLSLMDAGVPLKDSVAGIAMGLIKSETDDKVSILTDIQGLEDFLGDMDFKVAGTKDGITAIQMDMKIQGITNEILKEALEKAKVGRMHILGKMNEVIKEPRPQLSKYAPKIIMIKIDTEKIKDVIGSGGKVINKIIDETGVKIDIDDDGMVSIAGVEEAMLQKAKQIIQDITDEVEIGKVYSGKVVRVLPIGAIVEFGYNKDGLIHISKLSSQRVAKVEDVVNLGDSVEVEVIKVDDRGRVDLRLIAVAK